MPGATFMLWYPVVDAARVQRLERELNKSRIRNLHLFEIGVREIGVHEPGDTGMTAAGLIIVNPPWTLAATANTVLPMLANALADEGKGYSRYTCLVPE
jgi:23S rRNA (adenine2030-N6)-methyltransferase